MEVLDLVSDGYNSFLLGPGMKSEQAVPVSHSSQCNTCKNVHWSIQPHSHNSRNISVTQHT